MIACKSAWAAVQLARDIQRSFLHHDWGTGVIDAAYHEFEEGRAAEDEEYVPPTARLDAAVYRGYWNGLRVRVGVHTGLSDIRHDEVTKGYDYYGGTSNMAARTESVANGGQVLLTRAAYKALSTAEREQLNVTAFGIVPLRGVPKPVEMFQLNAVPGRTFAALRLDRDIDEEYDDVASTTDGSTERSKSDASSRVAGHLAVVITMMFSPFPLQQRLKAIQPLLHRWNVRVPPKSAGMSQNDHCHIVVQKLAMKLNRVMDRKAQVLGGAHRDPGLGSYRGTLDGMWESTAGRVDGPRELPEIRRSMDFWNPPLQVVDMSTTSASITVEAQRPPQPAGVRR
ncbi:putative receptor-type adenylate cyclase [Trypanosoma grayi]|uniref:putative receptor-type adenylate cyclase n=1 Tax=Trypanosoma grayi TaxID=71804 RepID=UPI0004F41CCF|nr:putative receptor-type adenylate cyclase [Trypanosoma grayi]KEG06999.1 putative receptor-type adenylate cyclase [Trypanosoma grayi]